MSRCWKFPYPVRQKHIHFGMSLYFDFSCSLHTCVLLRTGITCKKILCYMRDSACRWLIFENAKIFRSYVKHF